MTRDQHTILNVHGMSCGACVRHIDRALNQLQGVQHVEVRLSEGTARVQHDAEQVSVAKLVAALAAAGYGATPSTT
jgi:copper chaperone